MPSEPLIRPATARDEPAIRALQRRALQQLAANCYAPAAIEAFLAHIGEGNAALLAAGGLLVAEWEGVPRGCAGWSRESGIPDGHALADWAGPFIRCLYVDPDAAGQGLGRRLLGAVEARAGPAPQLLATLNAAPMYRACGYRALRPVALRLANGARFPGLHMAKPAPAFA